MNKIFVKQLERNLEAYVDDIVVKSTSTTSYAKDLANIFIEIRKYNIRLNIDKWIFSVQGGKLLGFMLILQGMGINPEKCVAIIEMRSLNTLKEVQRLTGWLAALSRFLSRAANTTKSFFKLLKKHEQSGTRNVKLTFKSSKSSLFHLLY